MSTLEARNLMIIETIMNELGVSDIEELPAKAHELKEAAQQSVHWTGFGTVQIVVIVKSAGHSLSVPIVDTPASNAGR